MDQRRHPADRSGSGGCATNGVFAVGLAPIGVFTLGLVALGLWSFGCVSAGFVSSGIVSAGWMSIGGRLSLGWFALADLPGRGTAIGVYAWGNLVRGLRFERARSWETLATEEGVVAVWRERQGDLPHLAQWLDRADALRLRQCVLWAGIGTCVVAVAVSPFVLWDSLAATEVLGWPLIAVGNYEFVGGPAVFAGDEPRAWISIGYRPTGFVAIGFQPTGAIALGFVPIGVIPVGLGAFGLLPCGLAAAGLVANGFVSFGWMAFGSVAFGWFARGNPGGAAVGAYAWGNIARGLFFARRLSRKTVDNGLAQGRER